MATEHAYHDQRPGGTGHEQGAVPSSFKIGTVAGIEIGVHWSWLLIFFFVAWSLADPHGILHQFHPEWGIGRRWIAGSIISAIFFASILLHELSHSLVAKARGIPVKGITLFVFGGVSKLGREAASAREEFQIAVVGPLTSLAIGAFFAVLWAALRAPAPAEAAIAAYLAFVNGIIAGFNMLPGFPLDGGRVFRAAIWARTRDLRRATRIAARAGELVAYALMAAGFIQFFLGDLIGGIWMILIGLFLRNASAGSYQETAVEQSLAGVTVHDLTRTDYVGVGPEVTVQQLVDEYILTGRGRVFPVTAGEQLLGVVTLADIQRRPRNQWPGTTVFRVMTPFERLRTTRADEDIAGALRAMEESDIQHLPVVDGSRLLGMIVRSDIVRLVQVRRALAES